MIVAFWLRCDTVTYLLSKTVRSGRNYDIVEVRGLIKTLLSFFYCNIGIKSSKKSKICCSFSFGKCYFVHMDSQIRIKFRSKHQLLLEYWLISCRLRCKTKWFFNMTLFLNWCPHVIWCVSQINQVNWLEVLIIVALFKVRVMKQIIDRNTALPGRYSCSFQ